MKPAKPWRKALVYFYLTVLAAVFLLPFFWMLSTSLKGSEQIFTYPPRWIPRPVRWQNYRDVLTTMPFVRYLFNTTFITVMSIIGVVFSSSLVAYAFARLRWKGRDSLFLFIIGTMMLPAQVTMIPVFVLYKHIGWLDSFKPLVVPLFFGGGAFNIFLMRQFFLTIPQELSDAARIDGCSEFRIYWSIILPLSKPAVATIAILVFMMQWNDFLGPLIFLSSKGKGTLALGLAMLVGQHTTEYGMLMAASVLLLIPVVVIFFL
ncbi:MAG: carbohydrate ABC transporter permease, partial [candidate division KSB1 bacterium]|nr:carbohydrate ABC transporter permease [candidate division KSB1 bacterium]